MDFQTQLETYLKSAGFNLLNTKDDFIAADKPGLAGDRDTLLIWQVSKGGTRRRISQSEAGLLDEIESTLPNYPGANCYILVPTGGGNVSNTFRREALLLGVKIRYPIQFFDTPFRVEDAPDSASAINSLRDPKYLRQRIPQPYSILEQGEATSTGDDLLVTLLKDFRESSGPSLRIVVGTAGVGKTFLFKSLFSLLYEHFLAEKKRVAMFPRPIPFIPEHLRGAYALRTRELINSFLSADVATPVQPATFEWMLVNGYAAWFFDGLDELYAGDREYFDYLLDLLTRPESQAQLLICARDSLLTTCETFTQFLDDFPPGSESIIQMYRLDDWDRKSKRALAWLRLEGHTPKKEESDTKQVTKFLDLIARTGPLKTISSLPYYCELLLDAFEKSSIIDFKDDFSLIQYAIDKIIEREIAKGLLSWEHFEHEGFVEWLETVALEVYQNNFTGLSSEDVESYAQLVLRSELTDAERTHALTSLVQFPLFSPGMRPGTLNFKHELLAEYLAGRHLLRKVVSDPRKVASSLASRNDFADTLVCKYIKQELRGKEDKLKAIFEVLKTETLAGREFANLLQLYVDSVKDSKAIQTNKRLMEGRDLRGLRFHKLDLKGVSFRHCDLSNARFESCNLREGLFESARLAETRFVDLPDGGLAGARFGNLEQYVSVYAGQRRIDQRQKMKEWLPKVTGEPELINDPCSTAFQLRALLLKFVRPDGSGRRDELPEDALRRGKVYPGAPRPDHCIKASLRFGYFQGPDFRGRIKRVPGDQYDDIVQFIRDWILTEKMRALLDSVCPIRNCRHIPKLLPH